MRLTVRRRVVTVLLVSWPVALVWLGWMALLAYSLTEYYRTGYSSCGGLQAVNLPGYVSGCSGVFSPPIAWGVLIIMTAVLVAAALAMARWTVTPVRAMADTVARLGPTSLGLRLRLDGPHDETRALGDAVDAMLDRVAEGYEAQRRFASNASHELRTPLATQRALIEVSLGTALTAEQLELLSRQLLATNERNERLIDGLLTLAETERGVLSSRPLAFDRIVLDVVDGQRAFAKERGVDLSVDAQPVSVRGELPLLERLVVNLVQNAIKYNHHGGHARVWLAPDATLTVVNTGAVVRTDQVASLFEPFHRLSGERLDHGGGVGLGLTIARSIVAAHRGAISVVPNDAGVPTEGNAPNERGGGLTVQVRLPRAG